MTALKEKYRSEIVPQLQSELGLKNVMAVPRISKITHAHVEGDLADSRHRHHVFEPKL